MLKGIIQNQTVKIQDGCSFNCSYCAVRGFRGPSVSEPYSRIVENIKLIKEFLFAEDKTIIICGINPVEYFDPEVGDIVELTKKLMKDFPEISFRFDFINPFYKDKILSLIDLISVSPQLSKKLCISVQTFSSSLLKRMKRPYCKETLIEIFSLGKEKGIEFEIELICGFPGETEEEFMETYNFLKENKYYFTIHVFSPMEGTEAATLPDQISESIILERMEKYKELQKEILSNNL